MMRVENAKSRSDPVSRSKRASANEALSATLPRRQAVQNAPAAMSGANSQRRPTDGCLLSSEFTEDDQSDRTDLQPGLFKI